MSKKVLNIYKPQGITPLQLINKLRKSDASYQETKIGYAGRLDPLAHGVLLLLIGEENKSRQQYLNLNKSYEFSVLFGIETDSYDYLGVIQKTYSIIPNKFPEKISQFAANKVGKSIQSYPPFSSKTVRGIPLYKLAKKGKLEPWMIPQREIEISNLQLLSLERVTSAAIKSTVLKNLKLIKGFFRQSKIIKGWAEFFKQNPTDFLIGNFSLNCSSGTYVRELAHQMGQELGCGAIAFEIKRTKVDKYTLSESLDIF